MSQFNKRVLYNKKGTFSYHKLDVPNQTNPFTLYHTNSHHNQHSPLMVQQD